MGTNALLSVTIKCSVAGAVAAANTALIDLAKTIQTTTGLAGASGTTARINLTISTSAGDAAASGITFSISDGKLPKGIKQVYCNIKDSTIVYSVSLTRSSGVRTAARRTEAFSGVSVVYAKRRTTNSVVAAKRGK